MRNICQPFYIQHIHILRAIFTAFFGYSQSIQDGWLSDLSFVKTLSLQWAGCMELMQHYNCTETDSDKTNA